MKKILPLVLLVLLVAGVLLAGWWLWSIRPDDRAARLADDLYLADLLAGWLWRFIPPALLVSGAALAGALLWRRYGWRESIHAGYQVAALRASHQPMPQSLTYAPRLSGPASSTPVLPVPDVCAQTFPTFAGMLQGGVIGPRQPLTLGFDAESSKPIIGDWRDLYSAGIGGAQGSGKTWTAVYLAAQAALSGARLVICDPHAGDSESLSTRLAPLAGAYLCDPATEPDSILAALDLAHDELERRRSGSRDRWPLLVVCDEWTSLMLRNDQAASRFIHFATEGRKFGVHGLLMAHGWTAAAAGGSEVRNRLTAHYVHRTRPAEARYQLGTPAELTPRDVLQLAPGTCYLMTTRGDLRRVVIPQMTPADVDQVGMLLSRGSVDRPFGFQPAKPETSQKSERNQPETTIRNQENQTRTPQDARTLARFLAGESIGAIARDIAPSGKKYTQARDQVESVVRQRLIELEPHHV